VSAIRKFAWVILNGLVQHSAGEARSWGNAMLREMDFVENDWSALSWALGSGKALCRFSLLQEAKSFLDRAHRELSGKAMIRRMPTMLLGFTIAAAVLSLCTMTLARLSHISWFDPMYYKIADRLLFVVVPVALYLVSAAALWRRRRSIAVGILTAGVILITHVIVHYATHS
jgi:hypothetical protein